MVVPSGANNSFNFWPILANEVLKSKLQSILSHETKYVDLPELRTEVRSSKPVHTFLGHTVNSLPSSTKIYGMLIMV